MFQRIVLAAICTTLALAPGLAAWLQPSGARGAKVVYNLYATDGYASLGDGSLIHIYGFIGGREGEPLSYFDESGADVTLREGAPAPAAGPITAAEAALVGHAQLLAPLIWAGSHDVVEVRLKNLGSASAGAAASPLGVEFRGLAVAGAGAGAPETSALAIPAANDVPGTGNVLTYAFRVARPGTYAYGWSFSSYPGHQAPADVQTNPSMQSMPADCPCRAMGMGMPRQSPLQALPMAMSAQAAQTSAYDPLYAALDGALIVYDAADAGAAAGPGRAAGGAALGLRYDQDFVVLLTGAGAAGASVAAMPGMDMTSMPDMTMPPLPQSHTLLINEVLPGALTQSAPSANGARTSQSHYRIFAPVQGAGGMALVRILNLSGRPQPVAAVLGGRQALALHTWRLDWSAPAVPGTAWAAGSALAPAPGMPVLQPGESADVMLDLSAVPPAESGRLAAAFDTGANDSASKSAVAGTSTSMGTDQGLRMGGMSTSNGTGECPMMGGPMSAAVMNAGSMQCPMMNAQMTATGMAAGGTQCPMMNNTATAVSIAGGTAPSFSPASAATEPLRP